MKSVLVDHDAALEMVSDRRLQSSAFKAALSLANALLGGSEALPSGKFLAGRKNGDLFFLGTSRQSNDCLVIDLAQAPVFVGRTADEVLLVLQRLLRFAIKYWDNLGLSGNEHWVGSSKAVVFPFPMSSHSKYRISIERHLEDRRVQKRVPGKHLLVYGHGVDEGQGPQFEPDTRVFRSAVESISEVRADAIAVAARIPAATSPWPVVAITELKSNDGTAPPVSLRTFDQWMYSLTNEQSAFVGRALRSPERIEGPAGTGKTLCLALRAINLLREAQKAAHECHVMFVTHGEAMKNNLIQLFDATSPVQFHTVDRLSSKQSLTITTLQAWCGGLLGESLSPQEYLDQDAMESKQTRLLYVLESLEEGMTKDFPTHSALMSVEARTYFETEMSSSEGRWAVAEMLQHEIGVIIKGRAEEAYEAYRALPYLRYGLPLNCDGDRGFAFAVFQKYKSKLVRIGQFDTDDVVLSAIGQLHTPIWRRRREKEGFDAVLVDETHLFNLNELSVLHYLTRAEALLPIAFAVDRSQAPGDRGITNAIMEEAITGGSKAATVAIRDVFRCSPEVTNLALSVTASGATLFTNYFENPLKDASATATFEDEQKAAKPRYQMCLDDESAVSYSIALVERLVQELGCPRSDVVLIPFSNELFNVIEREAKKVGGAEPIRERGDLEAVRRAKAGGRFVLALPDYVGGLEFEAAILVGVDDGRVPPSAGTGTDTSRHFLSFMFHSKLYVAITRARYRVEIVGVTVRGPSRLLEHAIREKIVEYSPGV